MKDMWGNSFNAISQDRVPNDIIEEQCFLLQKKTDDLVVARVKSAGNKYSGLTGLTSSFQFVFLITSPSTPEYGYQIMTIGYGIPFYPVDVMLEEGIAEELSLEMINACDTQEGFESLLARVLQSRKVNQVIASLLTIAKSKGA